MSPIIHALHHLLVWVVVSVLSIKRSVHIVNVLSCWIRILNVVMAASVTIFAVGTLSPGVILHIRIQRLIELCWITEICFGRRGVQADFLMFSLSLILLEPFIVRDWLLLLLSRVETID